VASERSAARQAAIVLGAAAAGLVAGLVVTALSDDVYRAKTLLEVSAADDPGAPARTARRLPGVVLAGTYARMLDDDAFLAGIAPQVAAGRLDAGELADRVGAQQPDDSALVELTAEGGSRQEAQAVVSDVLAAFTALVQQLARQRTQQLEDDLRRRLDQLGSGPAATTRRAALAAELARVATRGVEQATSLRVVAPAYAPPGRVRPDALENVAGGLLLGLILGLGATLLRRREPVAEPAVVAVQPEPEPVLLDATPPRVALHGPPPESTVAGAVALRLEAWDAESGVAALELLASDGGPDWRMLGSFEAAEVETDWDSTSVPDGVYWLSAVARDRAGLAAASPPLPVLVTNEGR
jgi:capsular polysaccharide biosynthesis protein